MAERWYKEAVIYSLQVDLFADGDRDGVGDLRGLIAKLDYLSRLGVTCLWLNPIHPSPRRDDGYDVTDYYAVDPRIGTLGDFAEFILEARERGMRVIIDLVVNHTSDEHPWFSSARASRNSPYRDWYVFSDEEPPNRKQGIVFPGEQKETWSYDDQAGAWYYHRFYDFQPDLNWQNPAVRAEIRKVMGFWLQLGVSGFRVDAAPFVLETIEPDEEIGPPDFTILDQWREDLQWRRNDAVLLCEANVKPAELHKFTGVAQDGPNDRAHLLFAFDLNGRMWLALARGQAEPLVQALGEMPALQAMAQWATFLRNHDELDLSRLTTDQRADVFAAFAPEAGMRLYERGIRRRVATMLHRNRRWIELAYSLQFTMPGTPVLRYGDEIGIGENLDLPGRAALRTPMQWSDEPHAGFAAPSVPALVVPVERAGAGGYRRLNVRAQQRDPSSLVRWFELLISTLRECPEIGVGTCSVVDIGEAPSVLVHQFEAPEGAILLLHNLSDTPTTVTIPRREGTDRRPWEVFADAAYPRPTKTLRGLPINGYGYRWLRLREASAD